MTNNRLLTKDEFEKCFAEPMLDITAEQKAVTDIWPYVDGLDPSSLGITEIGDVAHVYRDGQVRFDHVLLHTRYANVFVVIIVCLATKTIIGHHLLDLNIEYGITTQH